MSPQISKSENGIDFDILVDGAKVGHVIDLRPFPGKCPFHACLATPGRPSIGVFPTIEEAAAGVAEAHARRSSKRWPFKFPPPKPEHEPDSEPGQKLEIVDSSQPGPKRLVMLGGELIGCVSQMSEKYQPKPFYACRYLRSVGGMREYTRIGSPSRQPLYETEQAAAEAIRDEWLERQAVRKAWGRE